MVDKIKKSLPVLCVLISLIFSIVYVNEKSGYHIDEGMTLFLSNGNYNGAVTSKSEYDFVDFMKKFVIRASVGETIANVSSMLEEVLQAGNYSKEGTVEWYDAARHMLQGDSTWIFGTELKNNLVAEEGNRFNYLQVYVNQMLDVHPPLYYILVHSIFSLFSGVYSDYFLFGLNITFLILSSFLIYKVIKDYWNNRTVALMALIFFAFCQGYFSCAVYFRMYAVLTFFVVLTMYLHIRAFEKEWKLSKKESFIIGLVVLLGFATHYYYAVFILGMFLVCSVKLLKNSQKKEFFKYLKTMIFSGVVSLILWPFSIYHIFFGYRGSEAFSRFSISGIVEKLQKLEATFRKAFFFNNAIVEMIFVAIILFAIVSAFILSGKYKNDENNENKYIDRIGKYGLILFVPAVFYCVLVGMVAPSASIRYFVCMLPFVCIGVSSSIYIVLDFVLKKSKYFKFCDATCILISVLYVIFSLSVTTPDYLYLEQQGKNFPYEDKQKYNALLIGYGHSDGFAVAKRLSEFGEVMVVDHDKLECLTNSRPKNNNTLIIYLKDDFDAKEYIPKVCELMGTELADVEEISSDIINFNAYCLEE